MGRFTRIDLGKSYGVTRYQYEMLDDIELLCEIGFLINCEIIDKCCSCRHLLKFCITILLNKWDEIHFIDFFDVLKVVRNYKDFFKNTDFVLHWHEKRHIAKNLIREYKNNLDKDPVQLIDKYPFSFDESIEIYTILKETIRLNVINPF